MADRLPLNPRSDALDVAPPTPESIQAAKDAQAAERRAVERQTGGVFRGDALIMPSSITADTVERIAAVLAAGLIRAAHARMH